MNLQEILAFVGATPGDKSIPQISGLDTKSVTKYVAGANTVLASNSGQAILPTTLKAFGVTNFADASKMPAGIDFLVTGVRLLFDVATDPLVAVWKTETPAAFKNGEVTISQGKTLFNAAGTDCSNSKVATSNTDDFREVVPFTLRGGVEFNILLNTVGAMPVGSYKIELRGIERSNPSL